MRGEGLLCWAYGDVEPGMQRHQQGPIRSRAMTVSPGWNEHVLLFTAQCVVGGLQRTDTVVWSRASERCRDLAWQGAI